MACKMNLTLICRFCDSNLTAASNINRSLRQVGQFNSTGHITTYKLHKCSYFNLHKCGVDGGLSSSIESFLTHKKKYLRDFHF